MLPNIHSSFFGDRFYFFSTLSHSLSHALSSPL